MPRRFNPSPITAIRQWVEKMDDRSMDVSNLYRTNGRQPSQREWEAYKKLRDAHLRMGEWIKKMEDRYSPYYVSHYGPDYDNIVRAEFNK